MNFLKNQASSGISFYILIANEYITFFRSSNCGGEKKICIKLYQEKDKLKHTNVSMIWFNPPGNNIDQSNIVCLS